MPTIGNFKQTKTGYEGQISTLSMSHKVSFVANDNKKHEDSPDYFIKSGQSDFGVAWKETKDGDQPLNYVKVLLDGPMLNKPVNAALFDRDDGADLVWSRSKKIS